MSDSNIDERNPKTIFSLDYADYLRSCFPKAVTFTGHSVDSSGPPGAQLSRSSLESRIDHLRLCFDPHNSNSDDEWSDHDMRPVRPRRKTETPEMDTAPKENSYAMANVATSSSTQFSALPSPEVLLRDSRETECSNAQLFVKPVESTPNPKPVPDVGGNRNSGPPPPPSKIAPLFWPSPLVTPDSKASTFEGKRRYVASESDEEEDIERWKHQPVYVPFSLQVQR